MKSVTDYRTSINVHHSSNIDIGLLAMNAHLKIRTIIQLYDLLPNNERMIVDVLRGIVKSNLPATCKERFSWNVPYFYGNKGICIIWPATIPRGGITSGVLFGFWYGNQLTDTQSFLTQGTNKQVFYKIYQSVDDIVEPPLARLLKEAAKLDANRAG